MGDTITVTGNIASDPERRVTASGIVIASFRLASRQRRFDRSANAWVDGDTNWYSVSAFRALGEHAYASLRRGDRVVVVGRLRLREWETATKKGWSAEIDADSLGHDLLWGTTTFQRDESARAPRPAASAEQTPAPVVEPVATVRPETADLSDRWSAPLVPSGAPAIDADEIPF
ncbi:single-stranded DNA-binding protein [Microbacterium sp. X-17]|uniref:single-stranded DNA-binding protein n=1 Tax=Microbacterium sp. X-17 TaxID=3144404 RepID=UPI0031F4D2D1